MNQLGSLASLPGPTGEDRGAGPHVAIIGGGASGVLMAAHLLRQPGSTFRVTIVEGRHAPGRGIAYSTTEPDHLLNTRAHNMSAFADDPAHFVDWLHSRDDSRSATGNCFVSRATYGTYLSGLLTPWLVGTDAQRLRFVPQTAVGLRETAQGIILCLDGGQSLTADIAVLATGHVHEARPPESPVSGAWDAPAPCDRDARVVIVGSGLSMVDRVISLLKSGHRGQIVSVSRRGLMPRTHAATSPWTVPAADVPLGARMSVLTRWVRTLARRAESGGGTWRDAVDGIRPHVARIWHHLPQAERARFLRHAATWWDVHRHRIPPASESTIRQALGSGQLRLVRGSFLGADAAAGGGAEVRVLPCRSSVAATYRAALIFDCRGIRRDPARHASALVAVLLAAGQARVDPLNIGLDVDLSCRVINGQGRASDRLLAIGPASRAAFWEITAIPDIRTQITRLVAELVAS